jgi:hypothetical protein
VTPIVDMFADALEILIIRAKRLTFCATGLGTRLLAKVRDRGYYSIGAAIAASSSVRPAGRWQLLRWPLLIRRSHPILRTCLLPSVPT